MFFIIDDILLSCIVRSTNFYSLPFVINYNKVGIVGKRYDVLISGVKFETKHLEAGQRKGSNIIMEIHRLDHVHLSQKDSSCLIT